jgi:hypothetical protein
MAIAGRSYANVPVIVRSTLQDPPVLTTPAPVVIAAPPDRRWLVGNLGVVTVVRGTLQDPPVLVTAAPVVVAAATDRRWLAVRPPLVLSAPQPQVVVPATATPAPVVVTSQPPWPRTVQAFTVRNTLQDPPVLVTRAPSVTAAASDRRWFSTRPATVISAPPAAVTPPASSPGLLMVMGM